MADGKVLIEVELNKDDVDQGLNQMENDIKNKVGKISNSVSKLSEQSVDYAKKAALGIVAAGGAFAAFGIKAAGELQATNAQFEQVFGNVQPQAQKAIDAMSKEFGMVNSRLKPSMSKMTSMFKGLGLDTKEAMGLATDAVRMSADAAAFYDVAYEDANASLTSFLKGNYEAGESIGIFANDTQMATFAISKGIVKSTAEWQKLDEATKQATRLEYAKNMQKQAGATGQAAREADGLENVMGNLKQVVIDVAAAFGTPLLGPFIAGAKLAVSVLNRFAAALRENPALVYAIVGAIGTLAAAFGAVVVVSKITKEIALFRQGLGSARAAIALLSNPLFLAVAAVGALVTAFVYFYKSSETFRNKVNGIISSLKQFMVPIGNVIKGIKIFANLLKTILSGNGIPAELDKLEKSFTKMFPESMWTSMVKFVWKINDMKLAIQSIIGIATGSIKSFGDLEEALGGAFGETGTKNIKAIGEAIKSVIGWFKNLLSPVRSAGESMDFVNIAFKLAKAAALSLLGPFGLVIKVVSLVAQALGGGDIQKGITSILDGFSAMATGIKNSGSQVGQSFGDMLAGILTAIGAAIPGIIQGGLSIIAGFISGIAQGLPQVALSATQLILSFTGSILLLIPTIAASATAIIVSFLGALALGLPRIILAGTNLIVSFISGLTVAIPRIVVSVGTLIVTFLGALTSQLPRIINSGVNLLVSFLNGIMNNLPKVVNTVAKLITTYLDAIASKLPSIISSGANLLVKFLNGLARKLPDVITAAVNVINAFINGIANKLPSIVSSAVNLIVQFLRGIATQIPRIVSAAMDLVDAMVRGILQAQNRLTQAVINLMNGMANSINRSAPQMKSAAGNLLRAIINAFPGGALVTAGFNLMAGLARGIGSAVGSVVSKAKEVAGNIVGAVKGAFKIHSPSRVMSDEVGKYIPQGIAVGIDADADEAVKSVNAMNRKIRLAAIKPEAALGLGGKMSVRPSSVSNTTINNSYDKASDNSEIVSLLRTIADKPFIAQMDGKRVTKAISQEMDKAQGNRIKMADWGIEING